MFLGRLKFPSPTNTPVTLQIICLPRLTSVELTTSPNMPDIEKGSQPLQVQCPSADTRHDEETPNKMSHVQCPSTDDSHDEETPSQISQMLDDNIASSYRFANDPRPYLTVFGAFLAMFCSFGQMSSFGTYQSWYQAHQLHQLAPSTISWIGSLQLWVFFFSVRFPLLLACIYCYVVPGCPYRLLIRQDWAHWLDGYWHSGLHLRSDDDQHIYTVLPVHSSSRNPVRAWCWLTVGIPSLSKCVTD